MEGVLIYLSPLAPIGLVGREKDSCVRLLHTSCFTLLTFRNRLFCSLSGRLISRGSRVVTVKKKKRKKCVRHMQSSFLPIQSASILMFSLTSPSSYLKVRNFHAHTVDLLAKITDIEATYLLTVRCAFA